MSVSSSLTQSSYTSSLTSLLTLSSKIDDLLQSKFPNECTGDVRRSFVEEATDERILKGEQVRMRGWGRGRERRGMEFELLLIMLQNFLTTHALRICL